MMTVKINGKEYPLKYSLRALFAYEKLTGHNGFEVNCTEDSFRMMYAMVKGGSRDCDLTWDDFIDACDADPTIATTIGAELTKQVAEANALGSAKDDGGAKKK